jgi:hypothetical protein
VRAGGDVVKLAPAMGEVFEFSEGDRLLVIAEE